LRLVGFERHKTVTTVDVPTGTLERINMQYNRGESAEPVTGIGRLPCPCRSGALPASSAATAAATAGVTTAET
jgi:hypothetical protein